MKPATVHIGFTGTRGTVLRPVEPRLRAYLAKVLSRGREVVVHHGDCLGMDARMHRIAVSMGAKVVVHPPEDDRQRAFCIRRMGREYPLRDVKTVEPKPYLERNRDIVDACRILLAVPLDPDNEEQRSGTWATIRYARKQGKTVRIL